MVKLIENVTVLLPQKEVQEELGLIQHSFALLSNQVKRLEKRITKLEGKT